MSELKVGDYVVYLVSEFDAWVDKNNLFKVIAVCGDLLNLKSTDDFYAYLDLYEYAGKLRKASPEEIKINERIQVVC